MPTRAMLAKIHIGKKELGLTDLEYRDLLRGETGKESSKHLTSLEVNKVLRAYELLGWKPEYKKPANDAGPKKFDEYGIRPGFATPAQLRKIDATWNSSPGVRTKTSEALNSYIKLIFNIDHLRFIPSGKVGKILRAIEALK